MSPPAPPPPPSRLISQVPREYFHYKLTLFRQGERVVKLRDGRTGEFVWSNESGRIGDTFKDDEKLKKWRECCQEALVCCHENAQHLPLTRNSLGRLIDDPNRLDECPGTWDGLSCWRPSPAGQLAFRICPRVAYLLDFEPACRGYVTKQCFPNASWFINRNGHEWSDYSTCSPEGVSGVDVGVRLRPWARQNFIEFLSPLRPPARMPAKAAAADEAPPLGPRAGAVFDWRATTGREWRVCKAEAQRPTSGRAGN